MVGVFVVQVILTDVDDRKFPERRHVHHLVEQPLAKRAIAKETHGNLVAAAHLDRHGCSGGDTRASSNDRIRAQVAGILVGDMHGAAFAATVTGFFAE